MPLMFIGSIHLDDVRRLPDEASGPFERQYKNILVTDPIEEPTSFGDPLALLGKKSGALAYDMPELSEAI